MRGLAKESPCPKGERKEIDQPMLDQPSTEVAPPTKANAYLMPKLLYNYIDLGQVQWHSEKFTDTRGSLSSSSTNYPFIGLSGRLPRTEGWTYTSRGSPWVACRKLQRHI